MSAMLAYFQTGYELLSELSPELDSMKVFFFFLFLLFFFFFFFFFSFFFFFFFFFSSFFLLRLRLFKTLYLKILVMHFKKNNSLFFSRLYKFSCKQRFSLNFNEPNIVKFLINKNQGIKF